MLGREREGVEKKEAKKKNETNPELYTAHREGDRPCLGGKGVVRKSKRKSQRANRIKSLGNRTYRRASRWFSKCK